jgi:hypothetical protein
MVAQGCQCCLAATLPGYPTAVPSVPSGDAAPLLPSVPGQWTLVSHAGALTTSWVLQLALSTFGYKKGELEGKNVSMLMPNPFSQRHNSYLRNFKTTGNGGNGSSVSCKPWRSVPTGR